MQRIRALATVAAVRPAALLIGLTCAFALCAACAGTATHPAGVGVTHPAGAAVGGREPHSATVSAPSASRTVTGAPCPKLTVGVDGSVAPLFCANGTDNPAALAYYEGGWVTGFTPKVLMVPAAASHGQVVGAVCADIFGHGSPMGLQTEQQAYDLAANRAGWSYDVNTVNGLSCPVVGTSWAPGVQGYGQVEPQTISNNGDPTSIVTRITWSSWGGTSAHGSGVSTWVPPGQPTVSGIQEPVAVVVFKLGTCADKQSYNAVVWYFPQHGQQFSSDRYFNACTGQRVGTGWP